MKEKNKSQNKHNKSMMLIFLLLLGISIGFAYLTSNLSIFGSSILKGQKWDVHFENVQVSEAGVQIEKPQIIDNTALEYNITLDKPGDFVEFTVDAKNDGSVDAMVSVFDNIDIYEGDSEDPLESFPDYLDYSLTYAEHEDIPIQQYHLLASGDTVTYKVHVEYKKDITKDQLVTSQEELVAVLSVPFEQADDRAIEAFSIGDHHEVTGSTLSKSKFRSFGDNNNPKEVVFVDTGVSDSANEKYADISVEQDNSILAWMDGDTMYVSAKEAGLYVKAPIDSSYLLSTEDDCFEFYFEGEGGYYYCNNWIGNLKKIDVSKLDIFETTSIDSMFLYAGSNANSFELNVNGWDTSNVTSMSNLFMDVGYNAKTLKIAGLSNWNTNGVTNMSHMFYATGIAASEWSIGDLSSWDTSKVKDMSYMFIWAGRYATEWGIGDLSNWKTDNVTDMNHMFSSTGVLSGTWNIGDISGWDTKNVTDMNYMFYEAGRSAPIFKFNLSGWDTSNVIDMSGMFKSSGSDADLFELNLSGWDTSNVTDMSGMFAWAGVDAKTFNIIGLNNWDTSNVENMSGMFNQAGQVYANYSLDLSNWQVPLVISYGNFNGYVSEKVTPPNWVN